MSSHSLSGLLVSGPEALELGAWKGTACLGEVGSVFQATALRNAGTFPQAFFIAMTQGIPIPHCFSPIRPWVEQPLVSHSLQLVPLALSSSNYTGRDLSHLLPFSPVFHPCYRECLFSSMDISVRQTSFECHQCYLLGIS